jgi:hypothetical protein
MFPNYLKMGMRIFRMLHEGSILQFLKMHTQLQMSVKWWHKITDQLSEGCWMNYHQLGDNLSNLLWRFMEDDDMHKVRPHRLMDGHKKRRLTSCQDLIHNYHANPSFLSFLYWIFLFPKIKTTLKGKRFQDVENIKKKVTAELNTVPLEAFVDCSQKLFKQFNKCIQVGGDYFE